MPPTNGYSHAVVASGPLIATLSGRHDLRTLPHVPEIRYCSRSMSSGPSSTKLIACVDPVMAHLR
jgi:hypothetical protein